MFDLSNSVAFFCHSRHYAYSGCENARFLLQVYVTHAWITRILTQVNSHKLLASLSCALVLS